MSVHFHYFRIQIESDSPFSIFGAKHTARFLIHRSQNLRHHFYHMHLYSHTVEERSKFHPDHSTANNNQRLGKFFYLQRLLGSPITDSRQSRYGRNHCIGAGTYQQVFHRIGFSITSDANHPLFLSFYKSFFLHDRHSVRIHSHLHATRQHFHCFVFAAHNLG